MARPRQGDDHDGWPSASNVPWTRRPSLKKGYKGLLAEAETEVGTLPVEQALRLQGDDNVVLFDLRDPRAIERDGRIPGCFPCPRGMLELWVDPESPYAKPVLTDPKRFLFYCASGWRSALAAKTVQDLGLSNVAHVGRGYKAWKEEAGGLVEMPTRRR